MKKFCKIITFVFSLLLACVASTLFMPKNKADAENIKLYNYTISNYDENYYKIIGEYTTLETYILADDLTTTSEIIATLTSDLDSNETPVTIYFDNLTIDGAINLSLFSLTLSGTINLQTNSITFTPPQNNSTLNLFNLTISSTSSQNQIKILGSNTLNVNLKNCNFSSNSSQNYAIFYENSNIKQNLSEKIIHTTDYLFNYKTNIVTKLSSDLDVSEQPSNVISLTIGYDQDWKDIIKDCIFESDIFQFLPEPNTSFYETSIKHKNGSSVIATTSLKFNIDANGGTISNQYTTTSANYGTTSLIPFPTSQQIEKEHHTLIGYAAKINLSSTTYYFDSTMLSDIVTADYSLDGATDIFVTSTSELSENLFSGYIYDSSSANFQAFELFAKNNLTPTFIALWEENNYTITFNTNGGDEIDTISANYNTTISLPIATKTGYTFIGWFDEELENECTLTTMPDEDLTLYAMWQINSYTLTINPNNAGNQITKNIIYNTSLDLITELDSDNYEKTGYTFENWYTNSELTNKLTLTNMPAEALTVYASWTINKYTINFYYNHTSNNGLYTSINANYQSTIGTIADPSFTGYVFMGWYTDQAGSAEFNLTQIPATDLNVYARWIALNYTIAFYCDGNIIFSENKMIYNQTIPVPNTPSVSGYKFAGWFINSTFETELNFTQMPAQNLDIYAKLIAKNEISINLSPQTYLISDNIEFNVNSTLSGFAVQYLVNNSWTANVPTKVGSYDVKIVRNEDNDNQYFSTVIHNGLIITQESINIQWLIVALFSIFAIELLVSLLLAILRKRKTSYIATSIILPFGVIETNQFIQFIVALTLAIFGFVLMITQLTKLTKRQAPDKEIDETEDKQIETMNRMNEISLNPTIENKVTELLNKNGFYEKKDEDS